MTLQVKIGINPIGWSNDDLPSLGSETTLETSLSEGASIGYKGFELGNKFPKTGPELKAKLEEYDVSCVSGWYSARLADLENFSINKEISACRSHMEKLAYNNCKIVVYGETGASIQGEINTPLSLRPRLVGEKQWNEFSKRLNQFGAYLKKEYNIQIAYHHHMGSCIETPKEIDKLMTLTDPSTVGLLFDTGHCWFGQATNDIEQKIDITQTLTKHIDRINHVHCKDIRHTVIRRMRNANQSFLASVLAGGFTVPGDGCIDFNAILKKLSASNYRGWLVVEAEQDPELAPSYEYAKKGYETLQRLVEKYV